MSCDFFKCISNASLEPVIRLSYPSSTYVKGRWQQQTPSESEITASVQPLSGKDTQLLPEGYRLSSTVKIYSSDFLFPGDKENQRAADRIRWKNNVYEIKLVEDWYSYGGYYKAIALLIEGNQ